MSAEKLNHKQEAAAQLLATGGLTKQEIADKIDLSRTMLWRYEKDDNFKARVQELKSEFESFGKDLIHSKLIDAVDGYWNLIKSSDNDRVVADGYRFFITHQLGTPESKSKITVKAENDNTNLDDDILSVEYDDPNIIDYQVEEEE